MKKFFLTTLLILISTFTFAQVQWQDNGVAVRQGENIIWTQTSVACDDGTFVSVWTDTRNGIRGVYAQKVDENGNSLWVENGIEIYNPDRIQSYPIAISSNNNSVIVCWQDYDVEYNYTYIRVQKIDANGNLLWSEEGFLLEESGMNDWNLQMVIHNDGGVYIIWHETQNSDIKAIRLLADGSIADGWGQGMELLPALYIYEAHSDQMDGIILSSALFDDIYIQRVDENGNKLWGYNGTLLHNGDEYIDEINICSSICNEFYFSWRTGVVADLDEIMMQKTDINGNAIWNSPFIISENNNIRRLFTVCSSDSQPIVVWSDDETIFSQKIDSDGNLLWGENGITVFETNCNAICSNTIKLKEDTASGCILSWQYCGSQDYLLIQRLNSDGDLLFGEDGLILNVTSYSAQFASLAKKDQKYYLCWMNNSSNPEILIQQIIDEDGNIYLEENGEEMYTGLSGSVDDIQLLSNDDNPIILWSEWRSDSEQIFLQILDSNGSNVFTEDGIPITTDSQYDQEDLVAVFGENSETIVAVWTENRAGYKQIYAQGINTSGNYLWSDTTGLIVGESAFEQEKPMISIIDNSGTEEYYIGWQDFTDFMDPHIAGQKIVDGNLQWGSNGKVIVDRDCNDKLTDIVDNYYIWQSMGYNNENIFCIMVDENGDPAPGWPEDGLEICIEDGRQWKARGLMIPQGLLILWEDYRNGDVDIYGQIVTPDGNVLWQGNGLPLVSQGNDQIEFKFIYDNGLYVVWQDYRSSYYYEIYIQKFDQAGTELWQEGGVLVAEEYDNGFENPDLVKVGNKITIVWENWNDYDGRNICSQLVSDDGELLWQQQGVMICDEIMDQIKPIIVSNGADDVYITWQDGRSTEYGSIWGIYSQKLHLEPTFSDDELVGPIEILSNYPNPFNPETTISFSIIQTSSFVNINIFNIKGQKIKQLEISPESIREGINEIIWDGKNSENQSVASGIYFYQLNIDDKVIASKKCLLLK